MPVSSSLPDDHSRVRLQALEGEQSSDYINANYVDVSTHTSQRHQRKGHCASSWGERGRWCCHRRGPEGLSSAYCLPVTCTHTYRQKKSHTHMVPLYSTLKGCCITLFIGYIKRSEDQRLTVLGERKGKLAHKGSWGYSFGLCFEQQHEYIVKTKHEKKKGSSMDY